MAQSNFWSQQGYNYPQFQSPNGGQQFIQPNNGYYMQQPQQMVSQPILIPPTRFVRSENDIMVKDIPTDCPSVFIQDDYKKVFMRSWNSNGGIDKLTFVPENSNEEEKEDPIKIITDRLDSIEKKLESLNTYRPHNNGKVFKNNNPQNKEVNQNG